MEQQNLILESVVQSYDLFDLPDMALEDSNVVGKSR